MCNIMLFNTLKYIGHDYANDNSDYFSQIKSLYSDSNITAF